MTDEQAVPTPEPAEPTEPTEPTAIPVAPAAAGVAGRADRDSTLGGGDGSLLALLDRLTGLLERSDLNELEVEAGSTGLVLRKASAIGVPVTSLPAGPAAAGAEPAAPAEAPVRPSVKAPLTGIFYAAPGPGSAPFVQVGGEVAIGQVIGLIEAMKLFNEIKSDLAGRVVRVVAESGQLVKARQPLIEVEPL